MVIVPHICFLMISPLFDNSSKGSNSFHSVLKLQIMWDNKTKDITLGEQGNLMGLMEIGKRTSDFKEKFKLYNYSKNGYVDTGM